MSQPQQWNAAPQGQPVQQGQPQQWNTAPQQGQPQQQYQQPVQQQQQVYTTTTQNGQVVQMQQPNVQTVAPGSIAVNPAMIQQYNIVQFATADECYRILEQNPVMHIQEMVDYTDLFVGLPMANRYLIQNAQGQTIMMAQEQSNMFARMMTSEGGYGFGMQVMIMGSNGMWMPFLTMTRPWVCRCGCFSCCCEQPFCLVDDSQGRRIGHIEEPFACCRWRFNIHDESKAHAITLMVNHCRPGLCCACPCCCDSIDLPLFDAADYNAGKETRVGEIHKAINCRSCMTSADTYSIDFFGIKNGRMRAMVLCTTLFCDMERFNEKRRRGPYDRNRY